MIQYDDLADEEAEDSVLGHNLFQAVGHAFKRKARVEVDESLIKMATRPRTYLPLSSLP